MASPDMGSSRSRQSAKQEQIDTATRLVEELRSDGAPLRESRSLVYNASSVRTALMKKAIRQSDRDLEDLGQADQIWFREAGMLVIDLNEDDS